MSWWELFRQTTHGLSEQVIENRELTATPHSAAVDSSPTKKSRPNWMQNRDYIAACRYWNSSSTKH